MGVPVLEWKYFVIILYDMYVRIVKYDVTFSRKFRRISSQNDVYYGN